MRILFIGCGSVGANAAQQLSTARPEVDLTIADLHLDTARTVADRIGNRATPIQLDVHDADALGAALTDVDLICNAAGPFFRNAEPIMAAAIEHRVDYLDVNDDDDVANRIFRDEAFRDRVREAGIRMVIGCGTSPGVTNILARHGMSRMDTPEAVRITMVLGFTMGFTPAVLEHMFHMSSGEVIQFLDGEFTELPAFGGERIVSCIEPFGTYRGYYAGHGEPLMLPVSFPELREVTARLAYFPTEANELWRSLIEAGFGDTTEIEGLGISPIRYLAEHVASGRGKEYFNPRDPNEPAGFALQVEVEGRNAGEHALVKLEIQGLFDRDRRGSLTADPTPTAARIGLEAFLDGEVHGEGLLAPETCFTPEYFVPRFTADTGLRVVREETMVTTPF